MGNNIGGRKKAKVMKIDGTIFKLRTPVRSMEVVQDYPGHVLLESEAVKHFGIRAKPLQPHQELKPKKIYFLIELPTLPPEEKAHRRARSAINMSAKDRLECLMLSRRSVSDLSIVKSTNVASDGPGTSAGPGVTRVKVRLPKAQVTKLIEESKDEGEAAEKIIHFYTENAR
ncbi:uncharacterized protein At1g66480-like [Vitis riparia]|uniref:uncharacterized protein At1g66480-like n=1 Tax=Vitis riparia TaxID=96939 RepID=UPI00155A8A0F|nr:uncharacterized protein At1g66480-like [Vitis riparia]